MAKRHPGDYLDKRLGVGRQCTGWCDQTPCVCPKPVKRLTKKRFRQRSKVEIRKELENL